MEIEENKPTRRRRYTDEERRQTIKDVTAIGVSAAAKKNGIPIATVSLWKSKSPVVQTGKGGDELVQQRGVVSKATRQCNADGQSKPSSGPASNPALESTSKTGRDKPSEDVRATTRSSGGKSPTRGRKIGKRYTPSQMAEAVELAHRKGVTHASSALGMSRFTIYQWMAKADAAANGDGGVQHEVDPTEIEVQRDAEILEEYKRQPGLGPSQVRNQLRRKGVKVSVHTVRRVMQQAGYRPPKVERKPHNRRYEATRPNHLWHLDFVQRHINRASTFTLILLDDCSRFVVGHGVDDAERANMVIDTFEQAVARHGKPERVMHDRGSAFWAWRGISRFTSLLTELGIDQVVATDKEHNGKVENFNGNLAKELFNVHRFYDLAEMKRRLATHLDWYNRVRTHHALGGLLVPADRYYGRCEEVLARIEAGAGKDCDELSLGDRKLSLFSVTSENGEVYVSLMGRKLRLTPRAF